MRKRKKRSRFINEYSTAQNAMGGAPKEQNQIKRKKRLSKKKKKIYIVAGIFIFLLLFSAATFARNKINEIHEQQLKSQTGQVIDKNADKKQVDDMGNEVHESTKFTVHIINVGQGQSVLIDRGQTEVLIDGGDQVHGQAVSDYISPYINGNLEYVINTTCNDTYAGGLKTIYDNYHVKHTIYAEKPKNKSECPETAAFCKRAKKNIYGDFEEASGQNINLGKGVGLAVVKNSKMKSAICVLSYSENNNSAVIAGGATGAEMRLMKTRFDSGRCSFYVAAQNGNIFANPKDMLRTLNPAMVIISAGTEDQGGPGQDAIDNFANYSSTIYGTFKSGNIVLTINDYDVNTELPQDAELESSKR